MTCRTCDCADKAADTDEWVTFAKRPVEPLTSWSHHDIPELAAEKVSEVTFSWQHQSQQPQIARLTAERDALQVGRDRDRVKGATVVLNEEQEARARRAEAEVARLTADHLPRRIEPGDFEVERVAATIHAAVTSAQAINIEAVYRSTGLNLSGGSHDFANIAWDAARAVVRDFDVWLIEDAPAPVDPDAEAIEAMARVAHDQNCVEGDWDEHGEGTRQAWRSDARAALAALRETHDVTPRAEQ